jgi:biofilm PGA synthesis N-glycosyltransferase PgaC
MWVEMAPYWASLMEELGREHGVLRMFLMMTPLLLALEVPLNILIILGVFRWFTKKVTLRPKKSLYTPKISCIITCYSEGYDVQKTLLSLCEQIYDGYIEMIPVIDGATSNEVTMNAVREFNLDKKRYPKRQLHPIAKWMRGGRVSSLNAGLSLATGEIIMALDGDTSFDNNMVSAIVRHFEDPLVPAVSGSLRMRNAWSTMTTAVQGLEYLISIHMAKIGLAEFNIVNNISGAFGCFRKSILEKIGGWDTHTAEDLDTTLRIKSYFHKHKLRIPFEPEAIGHTDGPTGFRQFLMQRLRWDGDLFFLYMRKHRHAFNPKLVGWPNFLMMVYNGLFFQLILPFIIMIYSTWLVLTFPIGATMMLMTVVYVLYLISTLILFLVTVIFVSERPVQDLKFLIVIPVFPLFMFIMRCWSAAAMLNDAFRRGHEESSMAPWWVLSKAKKF